MIKNCLNLFRYKDWLKNIIIFFPFIFGYNIKDVDVFFNLIIVFLAFSFLCSAIYILNDILDVDKDRNHSIKKRIKPIASGNISLKSAKIFLGLVIIILILFFLFADVFEIHFIAYFLTAILYNLILKKVFFFDVIILSIGYIIRLDLGSTVIGVQTSINLLLCVVSLIFFILFIKRFVELSNEQNTRSSLKHYNPTLLFYLIQFSAIFFLGTCIYFILYENNLLIFSFPFLAYNIYRYYNISIFKKLGEFPIDVVIKDKILLLNTFLISIIIIIVYVFY